MPHPESTSGTRPGAGVVGAWRERRTPRRIVCLTEETTEVLYRMGEADRIVGISAFTVRPPQARKEKPVVSQFVKADMEKILPLEPDLALGFSDLQADICADLIRRGIPVTCFNQRSVSGILEMVRTVGALIGEPAKGDAMAAEFETGLSEIAARAARFPRRPRVYFEEWHDPMISAIRWVSELIEIAGGEDVFAELRSATLAKDRTVAGPEVVLERHPDVYIASWCGRKFRPDYLEKRPGWPAAPFMQGGRVYEIDSSIILQPGPAALTDGVRELHRILAEVAGAEPAA